MAFVCMATFLGLETTLTKGESPTYFISVILLHELFAFIPCISQAPSCGQFFHTTTHLLLDVLLLLEHDLASLSNNNVELFSSFLLFSCSAVAASFLLFTFLVSSTD